MRNLFHSNFIDKFTAAIATSALSASRDDPLELSRSDTAKPPAHVFSSDDGTMIRISVNMMSDRSRGNAKASQSTFKL